MKYKLFDRQGQFLVELELPAMPGTGRPPGLVRWHGRYFFLYVGEYVETDCYVAPNGEF